MGAWLLPSLDDPVNAQRVRRVLLTVAEQLDDEFVVWIQGMLADDRVLEAAFELFLAGADGTLSLQAGEIALLAPMMTGSNTGRALLKVIPIAISRPEPLHFVIPAAESLCTISDSLMDSAALVVVANVSGALSLRVGCRLAAREDLPQAWHYLTEFSPKSPTRSLMRVCEEVRLAVEAVPHRMFVVDAYVSDDELPPYFSDLVRMGRVVWSRY